jgi:cytidylate kinase
MRERELGTAGRGLIAVRPTRQVSSLPVVTIAHERGAGGAEVGSLLADRLGADLVDSSLIDEVARRLQLPRGEVEGQDERPRTIAERLLLGLALADGPTGLDASLREGVASDPHDAIVALTAQVIREAAQSGSAVIVGRGACFVLRDLPDAIHVFLCAPFEVRLCRLAARCEVDAATIRRQLLADDARRRAYVREVHGRDWRDPQNYDLTIDTGRVDFEEATELILQLATRRTALLSA